MSNSGFNLVPYTSYKWCKRCQKSLSSHLFYSKNFYCKRCHKILNTLSRHKTIISTASDFWNKQLHDEVYKELHLFDSKNRFNWMLPLFFAQIHQKQWHIYLYSFYIVIIKDQIKAEKALCGENILSPNKISVLKKKLKHEDDIIFPDSNSSLSTYIYDLSIPYIKHFYVIRKRKLAVFTAAFTRSKICVICSKDQITHEDAANSGPFFNLLTSIREIRLTPKNYLRDYNKRDGWGNVCLSCRDSENIKVLKYKSKYPYNLNSTPSSEELEIESTKFNKTMSDAWTAQP